MRCAGCGKEMKEGDLCIRGSVGEFIGKSASPVDELIAQLMSGGRDIVICEDCTERGVGFTLEPFHEREEAE